jgi:hypothetical protein
MVKAKTKKLGLLLVGLLCALIAFSLLVSANSQIWFSQQNLTTDTSISTARGV